MRLDLQPLARALARLVRGVGALGDDAFEILLLRSGEQRLAVVEGLGETDGAVAPVDQLLEARAPLGEGQLEKRLALELDQV